MSIEQILGLTGGPRPGAKAGAAEAPSLLTGLVSVVVPCCGQLDYTKLLVPSLVKHSRPPFELVFVDVGSLDGTAEYLAGLRATCPVRAEVVRTATDLGVAAAVQDALARARG